MKLSDLDLEQRLYRIYYALPGSVSSKRAFVVWLHKHLGWLTRRTVSGQIHQRTEKLIAQRHLDPAERVRRQRMDAARASAWLTTIDSPPTISLLMPVYNTDTRWLERAVESVRQQFYPHWQLCIVDDASTRAETRAALAAIDASGDPRITLHRLEANAGIAIASNAALELARGDYIGLLDHDDELARDALLEVVRTIIDESADLIYSDEDKLDADDNHVEPHLKPDFSPDYLLANNYISHFCVAKATLMHAVGGFRVGFDGAQDYDLILRLSERAERIVHIPKVLYHWRMIEGSTALAGSAKPASIDAGRRAIADSLTRQKIAASVEPGPIANTYRVRRQIIGEPLVSILIPFRDCAELLKTCVESIVAKTRYRSFEIIGIDNGSRETATLRMMEALKQKHGDLICFLHHDAPFNYSELNNLAAESASGEHLLLLNNDTEVISEDWLEAMLEHSQRPEVGVVGARLLAADNTVQHAGVIVGLGGIAGYSHSHTPARQPGYFGRARLIQNLSAVTFACAMTRRDVYRQLGGLNATELSVAFNDVDYCLRAREAGYLIVYAPDATLRHHESSSRGSENDADKRARFAAETTYMRARHARILEIGDPYYNPGLSLHDNFRPDAGYVASLPL
ncbi:MAG: glycosyltransferase family 2 protein [Dokdonella sp.]